MGFCIDCKKCNFCYDTKYFPEFCPNCYIGNIDLEDESHVTAGAIAKLRQAEVEDGGAQ